MTARFESHARTYDDDAMGSAIPRREKRSVKF